MAIRMVCSCGQEMVTEDEHAGRKVRCPHCQSIVVVPGVRRAPPGPVVARRDVGPREEDEEDYQTRPKGGVSNREGLRRARIGLGLHWGKALCFLILSAVMLLSLLVLVIMRIVDATRSGAVSGDSAVGVVIVAGLLNCLGSLAFLVMPVLAAVGSLLCIWLPERSGVRGLSMVACGLDAAAFFFWALFFIISLAGGTLVNRGAPGGWGNAVPAFSMATVLLILMLLLMLAGWILHMLVLKNVAEFTRYRGTADDVLRMLIIGLVTLLAPPILIGLVLLVRAPVVITYLLLVAWTGGLLGVAYKMLNLTNTVRRLL